MRSKIVIGIVIIAIIAGGLFWWRQSTTTGVSEKEYIGTIAELSPEFTLSTGESFGLNGDAVLGKTDILDSSGNEIPFSQLKIGDKVHVEAFCDPACIAAESVTLLPQ